MRLQVIINSDGRDNKQPPGSPPRHTIVPGLVKEFLYTFPDDANNKDAIGIRVMQNPEHNSISEWYNRQSFNKGAPQSIMVDGYKALRDGRTVYVMAPNDSDGDGAAIDHIYTNIYLLSVSDNAASATQDIFNQLLANWRFAANIVEPANRVALRRDATRLSDMRLMVDILESRVNLPTLASGSFLPNLSVSVWPSWRAALSSDLGKTLPVDPQNNIVCSAQYDPATCFSRSQNPKFECLAGSHIYQYQYAPDSPPDFTLKANLEYQSLSWAHPSGGRWRTGNAESCVNTYYGK